MFQELHKLSLSASTEHRFLLPDLAIMEALKQPTVGLEVIRCRIVPCGEKRDVLALPFTHQALRKRLWELRARGYLDHRKTPSSQMEWFITEAGTNMLKKFQKVATK